MARYLVVLALVFAVPSLGHARRADVHAYRMEQVWSTVVRLLRVDYGYAVRDRDPGIGYILFDYPHANRTVPGSLELVPVEQDGYTQVRVTLSIPAMPAYIERMLLDRLQRKLREDHGAPMPPPRRARPQPSSDSDADSDSDSDSDSDEDSDD